MRILELVDDLRGWGVMDLCLLKVFLGVVRVKGSGKGMKQAGLSPIYLISFVGHKREREEEADLEVLVLAVGDLGGGT